MFSSSTLLIALTSLLSATSSYGVLLESETVSVTLFVRFDDHPQETGFTLVDMTNTDIVNVVPAGTHTKPSETGIVAHYRIKNDLDYQIVVHDSNNNGMSDGFVAVCPGKLSLDDDIDLGPCLIKWSDEMNGRTSYLPFDAQDLGFAGQAVLPRPFCRDDEDAVFYVNEKQGIKNCAWLSATPAFQKDLCEHNHAAAWVCEGTCDSCHR